MNNRCKLEILPPAQAELEEIARVHMALSGPQSARNITDRIYDAMEQLTRFPLSGPPVRDDELSTAGRTMSSEPTTTETITYPISIPKRVECHSLWWYTEHAINRQIDIQ